MICGILVTQPGTEPRPLQLEAPSPNPLDHQVIPVMLRFSMWDHRLWTIGKHISGIQLNSEFASLQYYFPSFSSSVVYFVPISLRIVKQSKRTFIRSHHRTSPPSWTCLRNLSSLSLLQWMVCVSIRGRPLYLCTGDHPPSFPSHVNCSDSLISLLLSFI